MDFLTIKRTVTIPYMSDKKEILALTEIGGQLFSKDYTYQLFFEYGFEGVADRIKKEILKRGGSEADYKAKLAAFHEDIGKKLGANGKPPTATSKRTGKKVRVGNNKRA